MLPHKLLKFHMGATRSLLSACKKTEASSDAIVALATIRSALKRHDQTLRHFATSRPACVPFLHEAGFINNELVQARDGATFPVVNPANGDVIGVVPDMGTAETDEVGLIDYGQKHVVPSVISVLVGHQKKLMKFAVVW